MSVLKAKSRKEPKPSKGVAQGRIDIYVHQDAAGDSSSKLDQLLNKIDQLIGLENQEITTMAAIDDKIDALTAKVTAEATVIDSSETLLSNLSEMLKAALAGGVSQATLDKVDAIASAIDAKSAELAAAVTANTPAAG